MDLAYHKSARAMHEDEALDHAGHAADCEGLADCAKEGGQEQAETHYRSMGKRHRAAAARHQASAQQHHEMMTRIESAKVAKAVAENRLAPDRISSVGAHPTMVTRFGQPNPGPAQKPDVPLEFSKLFSVDDEEA
jgi:hypothetical protein